MALIVDRGDERGLPRADRPSGTGARWASCACLHDSTQLAVAFLAVPASSVGLAVLAEPIAAVCLEHGAFGASGVERTAAGLRLLAVAIVPAGAVGLVARCYYALGDFRTPVRASALMLVANAGANAALIAGLGMDVEGLALATALTSWGNLALLLAGMRRLDLPAPSIGATSRLLRMLVAGAACGGAGVLVERAARGLGLHPALALGLAGIAGRGAGLRYGLAQALGMPEWDLVTQAPERPSLEDPRWRGLQARKTQLVGSPKLRTRFKI